MFVSTGNKKLTDTVYEKIRNDIVMNKIKGGEKIYDQELAARLGVSRTPIREALLRLEREGFIATVARQGTYVNTLTRDDIRELYIIREALEATAAQIGARVVDEDSIHGMERVLERFDNAINSGRYEECVWEDIAFHNYIVKSSHIKRLFEVCERMRLQTMSIVVRGKQYKENLIRYSKEHWQILEAFKKHDGDTAEALIREHIKQGRKNLLESADEELNMFRNK